VPGMTGGVGGVRPGRRPWQHVLAALAVTLWLGGAGSAAPAASPSTAPLPVLDGLTMLSPTTGWAVTPASLGG
jgi:hypothetical protein